MSHTVSCFASITQKVEFVFTADTLPDNWLDMSNDEKFHWLEMNGEWDTTETNALEEVNSIDGVYWDE